MALIQTEVIDATGKAANTWGWPVVILVLGSLAVIYVYKKHLGPWLDKQSALIDKQVAWADKKTDTADRVMQEALDYSREQVTEVNRFRAGVLSDLSNHMKTQTEINKEILSHMAATRETLQDLKEEVRRQRER